MNTRDDYAYQKETSGDWSHNEADAFQNAAAEANQGYSYGYSGPTTQDIEIRLLLQIRKIEESVSGSYEFLKTYYDLYNSSEGKIKGLVAKNLREIIRRKTRFNLDGLFERDESFMNNELRDFLNLKEDGTMNYTLDKLLEASNNASTGWRKLKSIESAFHQTETDGINLNVKFVNADGREVIINQYGDVILTGIDYGTYNYADPVNKKMHNRYDVVPYQKQYAGKYVLRFYIDMNSRPNSYYWNRRNFFGGVKQTPVITISKKIVQNTYGRYVDSFLK